MLNKLTLKHRIIISLSFAILTIILFSIGVFGLLKTPFNWNVLLNYVFIGAGIGIYLFILTSFKLTAAFLLFIGGYITAFVSMFYTFSKATGFADLAGVLLWMITIGLVVALGIAIEVIIAGRRKNKLNSHNSGDVIDVDAIEHKQEDDQ